MFRKIPIITIAIIIIIISIAFHPYPLAHMLTNDVNIYSHSSMPDEEITNYKLLGYISLICYLTPIRVR